MQYSYFFHFFFIFYLSILVLLFIHALLFNLEMVYFLIYILGDKKFSRNLVLHFKRNGSRFIEQRNTLSFSVCQIGVMHVLLHVEITPDIDLDFISFICFM